MQEQDLDIYTFKTNTVTPLDWSQEDTEVPGDNTHLWEESWDDDDTSEDFSAQLKYVFPCHFPCHTLIPSFHLAPTSYAALVHAVCYYTYNAQILNIFRL